ncbi:hypothetical protein LCGC14_0001630 [marine sediment metagenome]|uniref:Uncharacterized protein n=1 Tax=marine sediment metagenome TaxID=412755 RepID=A0A0F9W722_9ZZZZ
MKIHFDMLPRPLSILLRMQLKHALSAIGSI